MARFKPDLLIPGDQVRDGRRTGVVVLSYPRKSDGKTFPLIKVNGGHDEWPSQGRWEPEIHWTPDGITKRCMECERSFRTSTEHSIWCRTCNRPQETRDKAHMAGAESRSRFDSPNWKQEHRPRRRGF
jgi:hypothetical protein